ncbi:glycosyltransferase family 4 protein [Neobacillus mesonae]|uniref:glycosyltransferase family 4 protein n=1 Tax=Neobacillus mesonae TaxID=1193713 RepID=UPI0008363DCC|nr:glycosyltransferase family 4 protein [Neobacillus mesonae]
MVNAVTEKAKLNHQSVHQWQLKILLLCWEYPPNVVGGLSRHVFCLAVQLAGQGHEVHVLTAGNGRLPGYEKTNGVHVHRVNPINAHDEHFLVWIGGLNLAMAFKGEQLAEELKFDLIHAHDWLVGAAGIALKEVLGIPLLTTIHATEHGRNNGIHNEIQQFIHEQELALMSASEEMIVCSQYMKESLMNIFHIEEKKMMVIPNGIEPPRNEIEEESVFPELTKRKYIFSIGRMVKEKGFETIIKAAEMAKEREYNYFFIVAGKGPLLETYKRQVEERGLAQQVAFIGSVTDEERDALIKGSEMIVVPSVYEPFGIVALEGMIQDKPVIVSNAGGMKGIVRHLQTGLLMNPGDAQSLLDQIGFLVNNRKTACEIGINGGKVARGLYGWGRIAAETSRLMEDMVLNTRANMNETTQ